MSTSADFFTTGDTRPILVTLPSVDGAGNPIDLTVGGTVVTARLVRADRTAALAAAKAVGSGDPGCNFASRIVALAMAGGDTSSLAEQKICVQVKVAQSGSIETFHGAVMDLRKGFA